MNPPDEFSLPYCVERAWPSRSWRDANVVLAVSSGPDSVAMLHALLAVKRVCGGRGSLIVAHLNHALRGAAADCDQSWLVALCERLQIPLELGRADGATLTQSGQGGIEAGARKVRYQFLRETAERLGARYVAVAHTKDDQVETVLHRIVRGTGLHGIGGMAVARPLSQGVTLIRPLLAITRPEVMAYLREIGESWRDDESNADRRWTRNRLRHDLLPLLRAKYNAGVDDALLRLAEQAKEVQQFVMESADELVGQCVTVDRRPAWDVPEQADKVHIDCRPLADRPLALISEVCRAAWSQAGWPLQAMGFVHWRQLSDLVRWRRSDPLNLPGGVRASRAERDHLVMERPT